MNLREKGHFYQNFILTKFIQILFLAFPPLVFSFIVANHTTNYEQIKSRIETRKDTEYINSQTYTSDLVALSKYKTKKVKKKLK